MTDPAPDPIGSDDSLTALLTADDRAGMARLRRHAEERDLASPRGRFCYCVPPVIPPEAEEGRYLRVDRDFVTPALPDPAPGYQLWYDYAEADPATAFRVTRDGQPPGSRSLYFSLGGVVWGGAQGRVLQYAQALGLSVRWDIDSAPMALTGPALGWWALELRDRVFPPPAAKRHLNLAGGGRERLERGGGRPDCLSALAACRAVAAAVSAPTSWKAAAPYPADATAVEAELRSHLDWLERLALDHGGDRVLGSGPRMTLIEPATQGGALMIGEGQSSAAAAPQPPADNLARKTGRPRVAGEKLAVYQLIMSQKREGEGGKTQHARMKNDPNLKQVASRAGIPVNEKLFDSAYKHARDAERKTGNQAA